MFKKLWNKIRRKKPTQEHLEIAFSREAIDKCNEGSSYAALYRPQPLRDGPLPVTPARYTRPPAQVVVHENYQNDSGNMLLNAIIVSEIMSAETPYVAPPCDTANYGTDCSSTNSCSSSSNSCSSSSNSCSS